MKIGIETKPINAISAYFLIRMSLETKPIIDK
jgi:hypothetical protein